MNANISFASIRVSVNFHLYNLLSVQSKIFPPDFVEDGNARPILSSQSSSCFLATKRENLNSKNFNNNNNVKPEFYGQQSPICHNPFKHEKEPPFNMSSHINNMAVMAQVKMMMMMMMIVKFCLRKNKSLIFPLV